MSAGGPPDPSLRGRDSLGGHYAHSRRRPYSRRRQRRLVRSAAILVLVVAGVTWLAVDHGGSQQKTTTAAGKAAAAKAGAAKAAAKSAATKSAKNGTNPAGQRGQRAAAAGGATTTVANPLGNGQAVTLAFGGDIHFEGPLATRLAANPQTALGPVSSLFAGSDLAMANLESAITNGGCPQPQAKAFVFHAPPTALDAVRAAGLTLVTEANNHGEDCGQAGLQQSLSLAAAAKFPVIGVGANVTAAFAPYTTTLHGQRVAIIAATDVLDTNLKDAWTATDTQLGLASAYDEAHLLAAVKAARASADTVVVYLHWGTETQTCPNRAQPPLAAELLAAGADIVVGAHAHVQLGAGYESGGFVDYGLGNLAFYDSAPPEDYSGVLSVNVTGRHVNSYQWHPAQLSGGLPYPLTGSAATAAQSRWAGLRGCTNLSATPVG